jgi:hypothetical protein
MFIKSCEPPPVYQISTIGRLEICTSASAAKGNVEKAYLQEMLVMHITVYHHLQDGGRNGVGRGPQGTSGSFCDFGVNVVARRIQRQSKTGMGPELYICSFTRLFPLKGSCLPLRGLLCPPFKVNMAQRL